MCWATSRRRRPKPQALANPAFTSLALVLPRLARVAGALGLVQGVILLAHAPVDAALSAGCVLVGVALAAGLTRALTTFGAEADRDRIRAVQAERRAAAPVLARQWEALTSAVDGERDGARRELELAAREAEEYLMPAVTVSTAARRLTDALAALPLGRGRLDVQLTDLDPPAPGESAVVEAVVSLVGQLLDGTTGTVTVRGGGTGAPWQVTILVDVIGTPTVRPPAAWAKVRTEPLAEGTVLVSLAPDLSAAST